MSSKVVEVNSSSWTQLSAEAQGCFENQSGNTLLYWVAATAPDDSFQKGHNLSTGDKVGFQVDTSASMIVWARTLSKAGDVIVTEY